MQISMLPDHFPIEIRLAYSSTKQEVLSVKMLILPAMFLCVQIEADAYHISPYLPNDMRSPLPENLFHELESAP